jgi:septal ring factor EnvC (AmiA/AmiB activator)
LEKMLQAIFDSINDMKSDIRDIKADVSELKDGQTRIERKLDAIPAQYENLEKHIGDEFRRQESVIETLAARSIRHESDIRDINRMIKNQ